MLADIYETPLLHRRNENAAARGENDLVSVGGKMNGGQIVDGALNPVFAKIVEIGRKLNGNGAILAGCDVVEAKVCALLIDDLAA